MPTLIEALAPVREYTVQAGGEDVTFRFAPLTYPAERALAVETRRPDVEDVTGLDAELQFGQVIAERLDAEVRLYGEGWEGVRFPDGSPVPLTAESFQWFRNTFWTAAEALFQQLAADRAALSAAGNPSGHSPGTPTD